jgi:hypothetical protein
MPKPKPKRPRPDLVERLCDAVEHLTAERAARNHGPQWIMVVCTENPIRIDAANGRRKIATR